MCVLRLSAWLSVCVVACCLFLVDIPCFSFMFVVVTNPVVGSAENELTVVFIID